MRERTQRSRVRMRDTRPERDRDGHARDCFSHASLSFLFKSCVLEKGRSKGVQPSSSCRGYPSLRRAVTCRWKRAKGFQNSLLGETWEIRGGGRATGSWSSASNGAPRGERNCGVRTGHHAGHRHCLCPLPALQPADAGGSEIPGLRQDQRNY